MTAPTLAPAPRATTTSDELHHVTCCDDDVALCGTDVRDEPWSEPTSNLCVVCEELDRLGVDCPGCVG